MPRAGSKCLAAVMNCFQELKYHRFSPSGKTEHTACSEQAERIVWQACTWDTSQD